MLEEEQKDNRDKKAWSQDQLEEKSKPGDEKVFASFFISIVWTCCL